MSDYDGAVIFGALLVAIFFTSFDPNVYEYEIKAATEICEEHKGVHYIATNVLPKWVTGRCNDGLNFEQRIP